MKKLLIVLSVGFLCASCGSNENAKEEISEEMKKNTQILESTAKQLNTSSKRLKRKAKNTEQTVDSLLNDI